jgi:type VI secretion system protein ImpG
MAAEGNDRFLELYARELAYLREQGAEFALAHPKIAGRLGIAGRHGSDPHVERMLESFAFLTARLQDGLDRDFPELTGGLLGVLYPQYTSPIPSMAIAAFDVDAKLTSGHTIEKGTVLFAEAPGGPTCRFTTCYPVTLWPITITACSFATRDAQALPSAATESGGTQAVGAIRIGLQSNGPPLRALAATVASPERRFTLRFFMTGTEIESFRLYDLLFERERTVMITGGEGGREASPARLRAVGFEADDDVLPYPPHAHLGYRMIQEYFAFPRKYLFFDVELDRVPEGQSCELLILLDRRPGAPVRNDSFRLGCTPIVNLFPRLSEPVRIDQRRAEYRLVADARRERFTEIHSIQTVSSTRPGEQEPRIFPPFYSFSHPADENAPAVFWSARRAPTGRTSLPGTDVFLTFVDPTFAVQRPTAEVLYASVLCTNRDLAEEMDAGARLSIERGEPVGPITCLTKPTAQIGAPLGGQALWRLVSNLSLNHLSLGDHGPKPLREVLRAYLFSDAPQSELQIAGIADVTSRIVSRRLGADAWRGFCRGSEVTLFFEDRNFSNASPILFGAVLSRFLSLYAHLNSFTELVIRKNTKREEVWRRWQPMSGARPLL